MSRGWSKAASSKRSSIEWKKIASATIGNRGTLLPKQSADGSLYFIRRPYQPHGESVSPWRMMLDMLLFPYRLLRAIAHFLNVFSLMFSKKPLVTAGGPPREGPDQNLLLLYGRVIDAKKIAEASRKKDQSLVPASWQLVCRKPDGQESIMASSVLAYDLLADGSFVYTNGSKIYHVAQDAVPVEIGRGRLIERVAALAS